MLLIFSSSSSIRNRIIALEPRNYFFNSKTINPNIPNFWGFLNYADCLADQLGKSKEEVTSWTPYPGGAPANVATALARLGSHTIFLSAIGRDELGEEFINLLKSRNVNIEFIQRNNYPTRDVLVTRSLDGDREFAGFGAAETDQYSDCYMDPDQIPEKVIQESDVLITGTLGLAYSGSGNSIRKAVENAEKGSCIVVIDVNWRPVFWHDANDAKKIIEDFVNQADILKVTDEEAEWLFGIPAGQAVSHPETVLKCIPHASGVLVSAGEKGSSYAFKSPEGDKDLTGIVPVLPVKVADTTGAGDAYLSGFVFFLLQNGGMDDLMTDPDKLRRAVEFATGCGAFTCTNPGAIASQPTVLDVESLLSDYGWNK